jgi:hypothetical protein
LTNFSSSLERFDGSRWRAAFSPLRDTERSSHSIVSDVNDRQSKVCRHPIRRLL